MTTATMMYSRSRAHRHRILEQRATEADATSVDEPSPTPSELPVTKPPTSVAALVSVMTVVGVLVILGFAIWKYRAIKRRKSRSAPSLAGKVTIEKEQYLEKEIDLHDVSVYMEKPEKAVLTPNSFDNQTGWVPQIKPYSQVAEVLIPTPMMVNKTKSRPLELSFSTPTEKSKPMKKSTEFARSPPPSYHIANSGAESLSPRTIPIPDSPPIMAAVQSPTPPTPPATRKAQTSFASLSQEAPLPAPSPRSESFAAQDLVPPTASSDTSHDESVRDSQKLPRLMSVAATFTPSLEDELYIKLGDTVRMINEYVDGWCLVQRVGRIDAPKGVVPRFCLQERRGVVPIVPTRKLSSGSHKGQARR